MFGVNTGAMALAALAFAGSSTAHLMLNTPVPYGKDSLNNSPLVDVAIGSSTSDYPCKQRSGVYDVTEMNNMKVGDQQTLSFIGSASHGGGTCQLAVSLDEEPTASSTFKLIQVYEGGCPITADGNSGTDNFTYSIPSNFPNGRATLAWTWYNRIGNREIYMNCAPITVTGGSDSKDYYDGLPDMYVINLPTSDCSTVEESNQIIPHPGSIVKTDNANAAASSATGASCAASAAAQTKGVTGSSGGSSAASVSASATSAAASSAATSAIASASAATYSASGMTTIVTSLAAASSAASSVYPTLSVSSGAGVAGSGTGTAASPTGSSSSSGSDSGSSSSSSGSTSSSGTSTCPSSSDGDLLCNGTTQFGLCNAGTVVWQSVAAGTTCSNGAIQKRADGDADTGASSQHAAVRHVHVRRRHAQQQQGAHRLRAESVGKSVEAMHEMELVEALGI